MKFLMEHESKEILERYGIKTARCIFVEDEDEALRAARSIGFPVVLKVASRKIYHKSEVGGVLLDLRSEEEVRDAFRRLMEIDGAEGVNVQPMLRRGIEVIVGVAEDEQFGSFVMFGLGGIFVEAIGDVSFRLLPIERRDAEEMVREVRGSRILFGHRGIGADVGSLVELLLRVGEVVERESVVEMDLNPVFAYEDGCVVADARIVVGERRKFEHKTKDIGDLFKPKSVAVIGASSNPTKVGHSILKSLENSPVSVYPINPKTTRIDGLKSYKSIRDVPHQIDLAIISLPYSKVIDAMHDSVNKGVRNFVIISSGFKEAEGDTGRFLQEELSRLAKKFDLRIVGPNTFGVVNLVDKINLSFTPMFSQLKKGGIALVSQSGGICHYIAHNHDRFSYIIHLGNRCDVDFPDVLHYLKSDGQTKVIALYVEGVENGRALYEAVKELTKKKPVVVLKSGRSSVADKASKSHTGSLAGNWNIFTSAMKQAGAFVARNPTELLDLSKALELIGICKGGIAILTIQAGLGIVASDVIEENGGKLANLSKNTLELIKKLLPPITLRENPIDLSFSGLNFELFKRIVRAVSEDKNVGLLMFLYAVAPPSWILPVDVIVDVVKSATKPIIVTYSSTRSDYNEVRRRLEELGIPVYPSPERAALVASMITTQRNF